MAIMTEVELGNLTYTFTWTVPEWSDLFGKWFYTKFTNTVSLQWLVNQWNEAFVNYAHWLKFDAPEDAAEPWTMTGRGLQSASAAKSQLKAEMVELLNYHGYYDITFTNPVVTCGSQSCWLVESGHVNVKVVPEFTNFNIESYEVSLLTKAL